MLGFEILLNIRNKRNECWLYFYPVSERNLIMSIKERNELSAVEYLAKIV